MSARDDDAEPDSPQAGGLTASEGTPVAVDLSRDRRVRTTWLVLVAGPIIWFTHFMLVYLVAEAGCTGNGRGMDVFDPPVPVLTTIVATVIAVALCVAAAVWARRWWRASQQALDTRRRRAEEAGDAAGVEAFDAETRSGSLAFVGYLLSLFSIVAVLFTGAPAVVLWSC